jgi:hypothetical protein
MSNLLEMAFGTGPLVGKSVNSGRLIRLKDQKRSTYVVGAHGMGKSTLLMNFILTDIERADKGVVVLDPHGDLAKSIALRCPPEKAEQVVYFAPAEQREKVLGLNPFEISQDRAYELKVGALMDVFAHTWYGDFNRTPTLQNTLETMVRTLLAAYPEHQTSFLHMLLATRLDNSGQAWRQKIAPYVKENPALAQNWAEWKIERRLKDDIQSSRQKIKHIIASDILASILCQPQSAACFQFQDVLSRNGVLLVNLEGLEDEGQRLIGSIILTQLLVMARLRGEADDRVPCHIYADEFYKFSPQSFVTIINEARKYRLFCTLAHQNLEQLDMKARAAAANCGNVITFRVNPEDSGTLGRHFLSKGRVLPADMLSNLPRYQAMVRYADRNDRRQSLVQTFRERGQENPDIAAAIHSESETYGVPSMDIRDYVNAILEKENGKSSRRGRPPIRSKPKTSNDKTS